jgi:hypothetical protein
LRGGRQYQSVTAAAPAGASGKKGPHRHLKTVAAAHAHLLADFCNKICQLLTRGGD